MQRMIDSAIEKRWDARTETPYAYFRGAQGELNRLDYDDGRSLGLKYRLAEAAGAAGVAMWTANGVGDAKAPSAAQFWRGIPRVSAQLKTDDASVVPARIPTVGGQAVTVTLALPAPIAVAAWCKVEPAAGGYSLAWPAADDVEPSPDKWQLVVPAEVLNQSSVRCTPPPTAVPGPGLLSVTVNGGANWTAGAPIMYYELVHASLDRRPYIREDKARLMLGSDRELSGAVLRVSVSLPAANASWQFADVPGGSDVMLPLPLDGLPSAIHNDMRVVVALPDGRNVTLWTRMLRTPPPAAGSAATAVQVDMASGGGLLLNGQKWNAAGWYMAMSTPRSQAIPSLANLSAHMQTMAHSGVNLMYVYGLAAHNLSSQRWLFDRAEAAGVKLLLELAGFQAVPPAADAEASDPCGLWRDTPAYSFRAELERVVTHARSHPAILGYFLCDDCVGNRWNQEVTWPRNYRCVSSLAQVYSFVKTLDPIHVLAGAIDSGAWGWWFSDTVSLLPPTPAVLSALDLGRATMTIDGREMPAQPTTQLSLDLFLCENYYANPRAHASTASSSTTRHDGTCAPLHTTLWPHSRA